MDDETSVEALFQLWIRVADQDGATLDVSVADERVSPDVFLLVGWPHTADGG